MKHDGKSRRWRVPGVLGAAALAAGLLAVGLPAGAAHAAPAAGTAAQYSLDVVGGAKALGHTWIVDLSVGNGSAGVLLSTSYKGVSEQHQWMTTTAFAPTAARELKVTSAGHASYATGKALSPVLAVALTFTPTKATKEACSKGSDTVYDGKATGTLTLATGLKKVTVKVKFAGTAGASLDVDKSCQPKLPATKNPCVGGSWFLSSSAAGGGVIGDQLSPSKATWSDMFSQGSFKTASKWLQRSAMVEVNGPAPKLSTVKKTVAVSGLASGAVTGAAVISYSAGFANPVTTCYIGSKKYKESSTGYFGTVKVSKPFKASTLLAGTLTAKTPTQGFYTAVKLAAA